MDLQEIQKAIETLSDDERHRLSRWLRWQNSVRRRTKPPRPPRQPEQRVFFKSPVLTWTLASLLAFLIVEAVVFRVGWYNKYLEPNSAAGMVESYLFWLSRARPVSVPQVMVIGDSRIAEGFSAPLAQKATGGRVHFWNFGLAGTTPRAWYYILRDADPTRRRFAAIVLALDGYTDEDRWDSATNRLIDINFVIGRLRLSDCWDFASSMGTTDYREKAFSGCLFKGITLRRDVQDLLVHRGDRLKRAKDWRNNGIIYISDYSGRPESLAGLSADLQNHTIHYPAGLAQPEKDAIHDRIMPPMAPQSGDNARYRKLWLNRILDLYRNSGTKMIFLELPRAPLPPAPSPIPAGWLHSALDRPGVFALPENTFRDLERPEVFFDAMHLNKVGREAFSQKIAAGVPPLIGIH